MCLKSLFCFVLFKKDGQHVATLPFALASLFSRTVIPLPPAGYLQTQLLRRALATQAQQHCWTNSHSCKSINVRWFDSCCLLHS